MPGMFRIIAFICLLVALMTLWGELIPMSLIFFGKAALFLALSYFKLSERTYLIIYNSYMVLFFVTFIYYIFFQVDLTGPLAH